MVMRSNIFIFSTLCFSLTAQDRDLEQLWAPVGHFNTNQAEFVKQLIYVVQPRYALEVGFCTGRSAAVVLTASDDLRTFISVDIDLDYMKPEGRIYASLLTERFPCFQVLEANSRVLLTKDFFNAHFGNNKIDWVTIDGDHSYEGCYSDIENVAQYLSDDGLILIDDYKSGPPHGVSLPTVTQAVDDFCLRNAHFYKIEWNRLGKGFAILTKSRKLHDTIKEIFLKRLPRVHPWLTEKAISFLDEFLNKNPDAKILEFGCGGSTIWFSKKTSKLVSIEHDKEWYNSVKSYIENNAECNQVDMRLIDRPYYGICDQFPDDFFDLILVDGRDRVKCVEKSIRILKKGGVLMLDNAERPWYAHVVTLLHNWQWHKTTQEQPDAYHFWYSGWQTHWWIKPS